VVTITTDEFISNVYDEWGESSSNAIVTPAMLTAWANKGQRDLCRAGNLLLTCFTTSIADGQETYATSSPFLKIDAAFLRLSNERVLRPMDVADRDPTESQDVPTHYWVWGAASGGYHVYEVGLHPIPNYSEANGLRFYARRAPIKMVHSTEGAMVNSDLMETWLDKVGDYCLMKIYQRLGPSYQYLYQAQRTVWNEAKGEAKNYINPLTFDYPVPKRDTAGLTVEAPWR
jgi:hypothetical protein